MTTPLVLGCYLTANGEPTHGQQRRESFYFRWESKATSYASCGPYLFLFSPNYIEIRTINEGRLVEVFKGENIRLVHADSGDQGILVAKKGHDGVEVLVELLRTKGHRDTCPDFDDD